MKTKKNQQSILLLFVLLILQSCMNDDNDIVIVDDTPEPFSEIITIRNQGLYPGKIDFNNNTNTFIVGSLTRSEVGHVDPYTGVYETFFIDDDLPMPTGILVEESRNRLLVVCGDFGYSRTSVGFAQSAYLGVYNLETGAKIAGVNFKDLFAPDSQSFTSEIAVDDNGDIYVTESKGTYIYKIDGTTYEASIFLDGGSDFEPVSPVFFGLNGIVFIDDYLVVGKTDEGLLFKVPLADPTNYTTIQAPIFVGSDGLELTNDGDILLVETGLGNHAGTQLLRSTDDWETAVVLETTDIPAEEFPTSSALANDGSLYVLTSNSTQINVGNFNHENFNIYKVTPNQ